MKWLAVVAIIGATTASTTQADGPVSWSGPGSGSHNPAPGGRDVCWSEPGDLDGFLGSSERIDMFGIESEIANDFIVEGDFLTHATWWGGQYGTATCTPEWPTPGFNLRFSEDDNRAPGAMFAELATTDFTEEFLICGNNGFYPYYKYDADIGVIVPANTRCWFSAQFMSHPFPGQGGRLTTVSVTGCESMFKSAYWSYPDWTPAHLVWGPVCDFGQEFVCGTTPVQPATWGMVKSLYR